MKITHIAMIVVIAAAIGIVVASSQSASKYVSFQEAQEMSEAGDDSKVHLVGELTKNGQGEVVGIEYNPTIDPNFLSFEVLDNNQTRQRVVCTNPPPSMQDFTKSEKVVLIGNYRKGHFVASEILMKCPSKYEETTVKGS